MKPPEAAAKVAARVKAEADPGVKEQLVKALGEIRSPVVRDTLAQISEEPGRIGVIAAGSLIAVGDASGKAKLEAAVAAPDAECGSQRCRRRRAQGIRSWCRCSRSA